ncbi:MAG: galactose oxidase-like domain-containing protein [Lautropia sp.]
MKRSILGGAVLALAVAVSGCGDGDGAGASADHGAPLSGGPGGSRDSAFGDDGRSPLVTSIDPPMSPSGTVAPIDAINAAKERPASLPPPLPPDTTLATKDVPATFPANAATAGAWSAVRAWPLIPIHAALLPDGRVMTYGTNQNGQQTGRFLYDVWDSSAATAAAGHLTLSNTTNTDLFCSSQTLLPGGQLFIAGGDNWTGSGTTNTGNSNTNVFNPLTNTLARGPEMNRARWYSSSTGLPDGRTYTQGGSSGTDFAEVRNLDGSQTLLSAASTSGLDYWYPRNFVGPDGRIFGIDIAGRMYYMDAAGTGHLERLDNLGSDFVGAGSSAVLYSPGRVLQIGGNSARSARVDFNSAIPVVAETAPTSSKRFWVTGTVLPDGRVLATGGSNTDNQLVGVNNNAELWNPLTGTWTVGNAGALARLYHSVALLLPDATVLVAGGGAPGPLTNTNAEIYFPPYLFNPAGQLAARPQILSAPTALDPGEAFTVSFQSATAPSKIVIIRAGSVTHSTNFDQRRIELPLQVSGNQIQTRVPASGGVMPPGFYLLFVLDQAGVPSVGKIVKINTGNAADINADWTGRIGGTGGTIYQLACNAGEVLVGVYGNADSIVRRIGPRCVAATADGAWAGTPVNRGAVGGTTGTAFTRTCASGSALAGFAGRGGSLVDQLVLSCRPLATAGRVTGVATPLAAVGGSGGTARSYRACGSDHPAYAIYGKASTSVDSFGLLCRGDADAVPNRAPVIVSPGNRTGQVGQAASLQVTATDPDDSPLTFGATGLPPGLAIAPATGLITGTPTAVGSYTATVTVADAEFSSSVSFGWQIAAAPNDPPVLTAPGPQTTVYGTTVALQLAATDPEGAALSWSAVGLPIGISIGPSTGLISGSPSVINTFTPTVTVTDGVNPVSATFSWTVTSPEVPPETCNRLFNGGFESGLSNWELWTATDLVADSRNGNFAARFGDGWIGTTATIDPGKSYTITAQYKASGGAAGWAGLGLDFLDAAGEELGETNVTLEPTANYTLATLPVPAIPAGTVAIRVWVYSQGRTITLDDVDLRVSGCGETAGNCNKLLNPGFEEGLHNWGLHAATQLVTDAQAGTAAARFGDGWIGADPVPVVPGRAYTVTTWFKNAQAAGGWAGLGVDFLDAAGDEIGETNVTLGITSVYEQATLSVTAPAGTVTIRVWIYAASQNTVTIDTVALQEASCGGPPPATCNRLVNPGAETGFSGWERENGTLVADARTGAAAVRVADGWAGTRGAATPGLSYTASAWVKSSSGAGGWVGLGVDFMNAAGFEISETNVTLADRTTWGQASMTVTAPPGTVAIRVWVYAGGGGANATFDDLDLRQTGCIGP